MKNILSDNDIKKLKEFYSETELVSIGLNRIIARTYFNSNRIMYMVTNTKECRLVLTLDKAIDILNEIAE